MLDFYLTNLDTHVPFTTPLLICRLGTRQGVIYWWSTCGLQREVSNGFWGCTVNWGEGAEKGVKSEVEGGCS